MKNLKKTRVMLACAVLALACAARGVETKCLDGLWEFAFAEGKSLAEAKPDFAATDRMPVPGCYDLVPGYYMKRGTGCYSFYGQHDSEGAQWSEEFQAEYLSNSVDFAIKDKDIQGVAVWQFCDSRSYFRGGSDIRTRPLGCNMAGLFDIHRREKLAAKAVRKLFTPSAK